MPNWNRIIVGDAFTLSSRDPNYYRDLFFGVPFFWSFVAATFHFAALRTPIGLKCLAVSAITLLLIKERLVFILMASGFCFLRILFVLPFAFHRDPQTLLAFAISAGVLLLCFPFLRNFRPAYTTPLEMRIADLIVGVTSFGLTMYLMFRLTH
jgi:hypothetical protein